MASSWSVRRRAALTGDDVDRVLALQRLCERADGLDLKLELDPAAPDRATSGLAAEAGDELIGFCGFEEADEVEVCGMVRPDQRGRGVGRALLRAALTAAGELGRTSVLVICEEAAPRALEWLQRAGGRPVLAEHRMLLRLDPTRPRGPNGPVELRRVRSAADREALVALLSDGFRSPARAVAQRVEWREESPSQRAFIAWAGAVAVGTVRLVAAPRRSMIYGFVVDERRRRLGLGRAMLDAALEMLRGEGVTEVGLEVSTTNEPALRLYRGRGFEVVTTYRYLRMGVQPG